MSIVLTIVGISALAMEYYVGKNRERLTNRRVLLARWIIYSLVAMLFMLYSPQFFVLPALLFLAIVNIREDLRSRNLFSSADFLATALMVSGAKEGLRHDMLAGIAFSLIVNGVAYWSEVIGEGDLWSGISVGAALGISASYVFWCVISVMIALTFLVSKKREYPLALLLYPTAIVFVLARWLANV